MSRAHIAMPVDSMRVRRCIATATAGLLVALALVVEAPPAHAVNAQHNRIVNDDPVNFTPHVLDGRVNAIVQIGSMMYAGGTFTTVTEAGSSVQLTRRGLFAYNASTGAISSSFAPSFDGTVLTLAVAPDGNLFVGGGFNTISGVTKRKVAKLNASTGAVITGFNANAGGFVHSMVVRNNKLYLAGAFTTIRGIAQQMLAVVDVNTGALLPDIHSTFSVIRTGQLRVKNIDVTPDGRRLIAIGNFQVVDGQDRKQIVMFDLTTSPATVANWGTSQFPQTDSAGTSWCSSTYDTYMDDVDFSPDGNWFVVVTTGAFRANRLCDTASRWETNAAGTNVQPTWVDWTGGDSLTAVVVAGNAVYLGGHQRWQNNPYAADAAGPGAVPRSGLAVLDPVNGLPYNWNPGRSRGKGVFGFLGTNDGLWVGSDTDLLAGETHRKLGFFSLSGGETIPANVPYTLPGDFYNISGGVLHKKTYDGSTFGSDQTPNIPFSWDQVRGIFALNGRLYMGYADGTMRTATFDGSTVGTLQTVNLYNLDTVAPSSAFKIPGTTLNIPAFGTHLRNMTGMFFDGGRIYYTVSGDPRLYYRYFTPESRIVGANLFVAAVNANGIDWGAVRGMTLADGNIYFGTSTGSLQRVAFSNGTVSGSPTTLQSSGWASTGMFVFTSTGSPPPPPPPSGAFFSDSFDSGSFANWDTWTRLTIDNSTGATAPPSALGSPSAQSAFARVNLSSAQSTVCMSESVRVTNNGGNAFDLFRLRTSTGGPIVRLFMNATGVLVMRSDFSSVQFATGQEPTGWFNAEMCGTVGSSSTWDLYVNGTKVVNAWAANTGSTPVGRIEIGDTASKTWTANFDDVVLDDHAGA
jgi:hypothetical protein